MSSLKIVYNVSEDSYGVRFEIILNENKRSLAYFMAAKSVAGEVAEKYEQIFVHFTRNFWRFKRT